MFVFEERIENYIAAAAVVLDHKGYSKYADVLKNGKYRLNVKTGYDNYDGGQYYHSLNLVVPMEYFEPVVDDLAECNEKIKDVINRVSTEVKNESLEDVGVSVDVGGLNSDELMKICKGAIVKSPFEKYVIGEQVGAGGNGRVFAAKNEAGKSVAIKFLERDTSEKRRRFKNEIRFCEKCHCANIARVIDFGCVEVSGTDHIFCVMPLYAESLRTKIKRGLSPDEAIGIFIGLLEALGEAHRHDVIHRDVKPENIMFAKDSLQPILCDFGIAHLPEEMQETVVVTKPTARMANFVYAAPEQRNVGAPVGPQADLYAAGLILNEMFTRQVPSAEGYKKIADVAPEYSFLDAVVSALYQQDPSIRLYPAEKVLLDLRARIAISKNEAAKRKLSEAAVMIKDPQWQALSVVKTVYENSNLVFEFDAQVPESWLSILRRGSFSHCSVWGCDTDVVARFDINKLGIPVHSYESDDGIRQKVEYFRDWVSTVNGIYKDSLVAKLRREEQEKEDARRREIARLEAESRIHSLVAGL